jgi:phage tail-like protein
MALPKQEIKSAYPLPVYNYRVTIGSDTMSFSEVSGLTKEYEKVIYKHGFSFIMGAVIIRAQQSEISITLKRGVVQKRNNLFAWFQDKSVRDLFIDLCDEKNNPVVRWKVSKAIPVKMEAPAFNAGSIEAAIESVELVARDLTVEYF